MSNSLQHSDRCLYSYQCSLRGACMPWFYLYFFGIWLALFSLAFLAARSTQNCRDIAAHQTLALLSIAPLLAPDLIVTTDIHLLTWLSFGSEESVQLLLGSGDGSSIVHGYGVYLVNIIVFAWLFLRSPQRNRLLMIIPTGLVGVLIIYLLRRADMLDRDPQLYMLGIAFLFLTYAFVLLILHILDPIWLAQRTAIKQLRTGMLVLDRYGQVASLNPAAERILQIPARRAKGQPIKELLPPYPDGPLAETGGTEIELSLGTEESPQYCTLSISLLKDLRGQAAGYLLLLHDVTKKKLIQAQIIAQQQALAMLHERERLARELHDTLGQVLGYASLQVDAAAQLSRYGQSEAAARQLDRLGRVLREAHADVREHILNLRSTPSLQQPFFEAMQHYLEGYTSNYDIQTELVVSSVLNGTPFSPDEQLQIFRIVQEALTNARKHSQAHHVQVKFEAEHGRVWVVIADDGAGFSPEHLAVGYGQHFGLQFMQERADQVGGVLQVHSSPGHGTQVLLEVPTKEQ